MNLRIVEKSCDPVNLDHTRVLMLLPSEGEATAEDLAMLQALYSRDPGPIDDSVKLARTEKSGDFMNRFYVGYGHDSIAEMGQVVIAIENVSMITAKLLQHYSLYRGQESSTRYVDFGRQLFYSNCPASKQFQEKLRAFYVAALPEVASRVADLHELDLKTEKDSRAARAGAFDILRGFLPCGATTNLSWSVDLRNLNERINMLQSLKPQHPELGFVLDKLEALMNENFANSRRARITDPPPTLTHKNTKFHKKFEYHPLTPLDNQIRGHIEWQDSLDFASWRDLARHRSVTQTFPVISPGRYHSWYVENLPPSLQSAANSLLTEASTIADPYAQPMCVEVPVYLSGELDKFQYIINTRTAQTVHPTLRIKMQELADHIEQTGFWLTLSSAQRAPWKIPSKRGNQTIQKK